MTEPAGVTGISTEASVADTDPKPEATPAQKAARLWVHQFARTLKTCRLYEQNGNTTVERFLDDLADSLARFHDEHGSLALRFTSDDVLYDHASMHVARSRDDNLALPFYRDGIRAITIHPGVTRDQIEALIAAIIRVTAFGQSEDDLVTLLWESHLDHMDIDYVPAESDIGAGTEFEDDEPMPWPEPEEAGNAQVVSVEEEAPAANERPRSDDWTMRELTTEVEAGFAELESLAPTEMKRFQAEYRAEHEVPLTTTAIAIVQAYLDADGGVDGADLGKFLPRVLQEALGNGSWLEAAETIGLLERHGAGQWSKETFLQELMQPITVAGLASKLDEQEVESLLDYIELARGLGETEVDVLVAALAQCESRRNRRILADAVAQRCRDNPERLAPWLADPRWYVVRNIVHMLGAIGGAEVVGTIESVLRHPEPRVRYAVIATLSAAPRRSARPLLLSMLDDPDTRAFCSVLQVLADARDPEVARRAFTMIQQPEFEKRPSSERRALFQALAATGDDAIVPDIDAEMYRGNWFSLGRDDHLLMLARCMARIGTHNAMAALERGAQSRRTPVRKACEEALLGWGPKP